MDLNQFTASDFAILGSWTDQLAKAYDYADGENPLNQPRTGTMLQLISDYLTKSGAVSLAVINKTGGSLAANKLVRVTGFDTATGCFTIALAANTAGAAVGVLESALADGAQANIRNSFVLSASGLNTAGAAVNDAVYLGTSGNFTLTPPLTSNAVIQVVGYVKTLSASGDLAITIQPPAARSPTSILNSALVYTGTLTVASGGATGTVVNPPGFVNDKPCFASISGKVGGGALTNAVAVSAVVCTGGSINVALTGDPGLGGAQIHVWQDLR